MSRNLKVTGVALVAATAFMALTAAGASAVEFHKTNMGNTVYSGSQVTQNVFTVPEGSLRCSTVTLSAETVETTTNALTFNPTYAGCEFGALGKNSATVTMGNCDYVIAANGLMDILCSSGNMVIDVAVAGVKKCTITIPPQINIGNIAYTNNADNTVTFSFNLANMFYETTTGSGAGACTATTLRQGATYTGTVKVAGTIMGVAERIWVA